MEDSHLYAAFFFLLSGMNFAGAALCMRKFNRSEPVVRVNYGMYVLCCVVGCLIFLAAGLSELKP